MAENFPGFGPDFSSLAEKSKSSPEKKVDDDDDDDDFEAPKKIEKKAAKPEKSPEKSDKSDEKESKVPLENLAEDEKQMIVTARKNEVGAELARAEIGSVEEQEALTAATYLEVLENEIADDQSIEQALENSVDAALDIAGIETPAEDEPDDTDTITPAPSASSGTQPTAVPPINPNTPANTPPAPPNLPPVPPTNTPGGAGGVPPFVPNEYPGYSANTVPNAAPNVVTNTIYERRSAGGPLLVGGIIGYMIGRRRGRIKTEKKLLPVQKKLETQVVNLQTQIAAGEAKVRNVVREQVRNRPEMPIKIVERMQALQEVKHAKATEYLPPKPVIKKPEKLGMFALSSERAKVPEKIKDVASMNTAELLQIAGNIGVEQSNVKKLFESGRMDDRGLRRVIKAYLNGEKLQKAIQENLLGVSEKSYEKLPDDQQMNDDQAQASASARTAMNYDQKLGTQNRPFEPSSLPFSGNDHASATANSADKDNTIYPTKYSTGRLGIIIAGLVVAVLLIIWAL